MSTFNDLLNNVQATIQGLSLTWGNPPVSIPVLVSDEALNREGIEPTPLPNIFVAPAPNQGEQVSQAATGNLVDVVYPISISIVASGNAQFETNLPAYLDLREQIKWSLQRVHYGNVLGMWFVAVVPKQVLNMDMQRDNYDLSILEVNFTVTESAVKP